jgi:REP element-mobilizing transposase RayT
MQKASVRKSTRISGTDYSGPGGYFITMCIDRMENRLGYSIENELRLSPAGDLITALWKSNAERFPGIELDAFVVMPNHMHAIVFLGSDPSNRPTHTLSRIVQAFKSVSTIEYGRRVKAGEFPPYNRALWQRSFNDRMLRDDRDVEAARNYIESNPYRWIERAKTDRDHARILKPNETGGDKLRSPTS